MRATTLPRGNKGMPWPRWTVPLRFLSNALVVGEGALVFLSQNGAEN